MIFTDSHAKMNKKLAGEKYQPSNENEGYKFLNAYCKNCAYKSDCTIVEVTMAFDVDDDEYPKEWIYGNDGQPQCTAFTN